jgi:hypothetical protein
MFDEEFFERVYVGAAPDGAASDGVVPDALFPPAFILPDKAVPTAAEFLNGMRAVGVYYNKCRGNASIA